MDVQIDVLSSQLKQQWKWWMNRDEYKKMQDDCERLLTQLMKHESTQSTIGFMLKFYFTQGTMAPWVTTKSFEIARTYLDGCDNAIEVVIDLIQQTFEDYKNLGLISEVSKSGYNTASRIKIQDRLLGRSYTASLDKREIFKKNNVTAIGFLNYLILKCDKVENNWRHILPLLLMFLDDTDMMVKREATISLILLCDRLGTNDTIIESTQTLPLLTQSLQSMLLAIPSLTPESQSSILLPVAYTAIFKLYKTSISDDMERYIKLSALLNDTLLPSLTKCKDSILMMKVLTNITLQFLHECGDYQMVVSKPIIYTVLTILMDPYVAHAIDIVNQCIDVIIKCLEFAERKERYKYDVEACLRTLRRRIDNLPEDTRDKFSNLRVLLEIT